MITNEEVTVVNANKRQISGEHEEEPIRKRKYTIERYTAQGKYEDEITMLFDDGKQLYVSKNFLRHISHIFSAMFDKNSQFVENKTGILKMVDKSYYDVRELLFHLDPNIQKEVERTNVFEIVHRAEEYMIVGSIRKCRNCLLTLLVKMEDNLSGLRYTEASEGTINNYQTFIVDILLTASTYDYRDILERAGRVISKWQYFGSNWPQCYDRISEGDKLKILEYRLGDKDDKLVPARKGANAAKVPLAKC